MIRGDAMRTAHARSAPRRRLVALLWLALLLPIAQIAASWHVLSHVTRGGGSSGHDGQALQQPQCELCLSAAAVNGGALPAAPPALTRPPARHELPQAAPAGLWIAPPAPPYRSRAPPFAQS